ATRTAAASRSAPSQPDPVARSASHPPSQFPSASARRMRPITLVQTNCDWPKNGASARGAVISTTSTPIPERNAVSAWIAITAPRAPRAGPRPLGGSSVELDGDAGRVDFAGVAVGPPERPVEGVFHGPLQDALEPLGLGRVGGSAATMDDAD